MDKNLDIKEQDKQKIIDQIFSLVNQIDNMSKIISKNSSKSESNSSNKSEEEEEWVKWSWTEFEIIWENKKFKGRYWWNSKNQDGIEWEEEKPNFGQKEKEIISYIKNKIKQELPIIKKKEIWQLAT
jgi:hypothetical protein